MDLHTARMLRRAALHPQRRDHARARDRRNDGDLQRRQCRHPAAAAVSGLAAAGLDRRAQRSTDLPRFSASTANYLSWRTRTQVFDEMGAVGFVQLSGDGQDAEQVSGAPITPSVFPFSGCSCARPRRAGDDVGCTARGDDQRRVWRRRFASDPNVIGKHVMVNALDVEIVGSRRRRSRCWRRAICGCHSMPSRSAPAESRRLGHRSTQIWRDARAGAGGDGHCRERWPPRRPRSRTGASASSRSRTGSSALSS